MSRKDLSAEEIRNLLDDLDEAQRLVAQAKELVDTYCSATGDSYARQYLYSKLDIVVEGGAYHSPHELSLPKLIRSFKEENAVEECPDCGGDSCEKCDYQGIIKVEEGEE